MKNKIQHIIAFFLINVLNFCGTICIDEHTDFKMSEQKFKIDEPKGNRRKKAKKTISLHYENEDLIDVINFMAALRDVNIVLPQGANAITNKVTMHIDKKVSLDQAWKILNTLLDIAGYTLMPKGDLYIIVKNNPNISKEPLPLYIGMLPEKLPDSDQRIRYIYYFDNLKVTDDANSELNTILQNYLPPITAGFKVDPNSNAVIISAKANDIRALMKIVIELDKIDFQEVLEVIPLRHTTSKFISDLFNEHILKAAQDFNRYRLDARQQTEATFFSKYVKIFSEDRTNSLIVLGRPQAVERVKDFIFKYLDVELDSGKSILHIYQLQYLDAQSMEGILNRIVQSAQQGGSDQARVAGGATIGGIARTFEDVKIKADTPLSADRKYFGGNKLVIAARQDDWKVLERLIQELDVPQPQVLIEVLVADLTLDDSRIIGTLLRNPAALPLMGDTNAQFANIGAVITDKDAQGNPITLQADLLQQTFNQPLPPNPVSIAKILGNQNPGSTFISLNDQGCDGIPSKTYGLIQILQKFTNSKIISHPHVIATNNFKAVIEIGETRLLVDESVASGGTTTTIKRRKEKAFLIVNITPRISSANTVLLDVTVNVEDFTSAVFNTRIVRQVATNALVKNKDILALGGLIRLNSNDFLSETPILARIPIIGYFFKNRNSNQVKTNLTIFISPTIIEPRLRSGVDQYTKQYINLTKSYSLEGSLFDSLKDPITRWFFATDVDADTAIDEFVAKDEFKNKGQLEQEGLPETTTQKKDRRARKRRTNQSLTSRNVLAAKQKEVAQIAKTPEEREELNTWTEKALIQGEPEERKAIISDTKNKIVSSTPKTSLDKLQQLQKLIEADTQNSLLNA